jgi:hypothetical protein
MNAAACQTSSGEKGDQAITLPQNQWVNHGEAVLSTDTGNPPGTPVTAGDHLTLQARSVLILRQT